MAIVIKNFASISGLGFGKEEVFSTYASNKSCISKKEVGGKEDFVCALPKHIEKILDEFIATHPRYNQLDRTVILGLLAARQLQVSESNNETGVSIGSSRGATASIENTLTQFITKQNVPVKTSPVTTLGNVSSWIMQDLKLKGLSISNSTTCSSALQAVINGYAWLESGLVSSYITGGVEAPLTPYTLAQMKALRIYASDNNDSFPCVPFGVEKTTGQGMVLGEGASLFLFEKNSNPNKGDIILESFGFSSEAIEHPTYLSENGECLYLAMTKALNKLDQKQDVDVIVAHAPGTDRGDEAELMAIEKAFDGRRYPIITSNKWFLGHTFGASGAFSLEYAIYILLCQSICQFPYQTMLNKHENNTTNFKRIMINSTGFGGNAISLIIKIIN
jgi:3-oxoacyl-[acyl-carrier-protein] synthase II